MQIQDHVQVSENTYLNKKTASRIVGVTTRTLERAGKSGALKYYRPSPGIWRTTLADIHAWMKAASSVANETKAEQ